MCKKRILYFDILNIIACISVVFLHCNGIVHSFSNTIAWKQALVIEVICYFAVPIFLMLTGANLLDYKNKYDTKTFLKKRVLKVLIPYIIWSYIYFIIYRDSFNLINFGKEFFNTSIESVFWFFPLILSIYMIIPVITNLTNEKNYRTLKYIVILIFIFQSILFPICKILDINYPNMFSDLSGGLGYFIFVILGYLLSKKEISKKRRILLYILGIFCLIIRYIYTYHFSIESGVLNKDLFSYISFISLIPSVSVFIFIKNVNWNFIKIRNFDKLVTNLSSCSFGIYLIHILVKSKLTNIFHLNIYSFGYRIIFPIILYIICLLIVYLIKKIPILKNIVP